MKYIILCVILIILIIVYMKFNSSKTTILEKKWTALVNCTTSAEEVEKIEDIANYMKDKASFTLTAINNQGKEKPIAFDHLKINDLKEVSLKVYLRNGEEFTGTGWKPKNKDNLFIFFRE